MREAREFLRALRGTRSQVAFSRRIGYASNVAAQWESGRRMPTAARAFAAAQRVGIDVRGGFERFHADSSRSLDGPARGPTIDDARLARWLQHQRGTRSIAEVVKSSTLSRYQVSRALSGVAKPKLPEFFELVRVLSGRLPEFIGCFVPIEAVPSAFDSFQKNAVAKTLVSRKPWCAVVLTLIDTEEYRKSKLADLEFLASKLPLDRAVLSDCLQELQHAEVLRVLRGKLVLHRPLTVDLAGPEAMRLRAHWGRASADRLLSPGPDDVFSYNLISLSHQDFARVQTLQRDFFRQVRAIVARSRPNECAGMLAWHLVKWSNE